MRLAKLVIHHYKSLVDVELDNIQPVTILVGCNGVGKSNVVDVLRFLHDALGKGLDHAVSIRGGIGLIRQYSSNKPYQVTLEFCFVDDKNPEVSFRYQLCLTSLKEGNFKVEREQGEWFDSPTILRTRPSGDDVGKPMRFERKSNGTINLRIDGKSAKLLYPKQFSQDSLAFGEMCSTEDSAFVRFGGGIYAFIQNMRFSSIYPNTLRHTAHPDTDPVLKEDGSNWSSILRSMRKTSRGKQALEQIKEMMQIVMPQLEDISTQAVGGFIHPRFKVKGKSGSVHFFDPSQISDGTLRILGILLALYQIPHPSLMVVEEPEQTVNPALLAVLVDAFRESSERTQLLITSHSPHLVDLFDPENIRVVTMQEGDTYVSPIRSSQQEAIKEHLLSLEQIMSAEGLLPEDA